MGVMGRLSAGEVAHADSLATISLTKGMWGVGGWETIGEGDEVVWSRAQGGAEKRLNYRYI